MEQALEQKIKALIAEACGGPAALGPGVDLVAAGLMDSLALITLFEGLEDLGVALQPTQVPGEALHTVQGILGAVQSALE